MVRILSILLFFFPMLASAETFLCVSEAGAGVEHGGNNGIKAAVYDVSDKKFVQTNEGGDWKVKELGKDYPIFDNCSSEYFCERKEMYAGVFIRGKDGIFSVTWLAGGKNQQIMLVAKGRCSRI